MKKHVIRREFLKLKIKGKSYKEYKGLLKEKFNVEFTIRTLRNWWSRFNATDWDLRDIIQRSKNRYNTE